MLLFLFEFLLRSRRSLITEKGSLASLPSSKRRAKCEGPTAICFTSSRMLVRAELTWTPYLLILSATDLSLSASWSWVPGSGWTTNCIELMVRSSHPGSVS